MTGILELISQAVGLTDTVLRYIDKNRDHNLKKKVYKLIGKINEEETKLPEDRDDQLLVSYYDELTILVSVFQHIIANVQITKKGLPILPPK